MRISGLAYLDWLRRDAIERWKRLNAAYQPVCDNEAPIPCPFPAADTRRMLDEPLFGAVRT